mgnify:CR=1 FL=1
MNRVSIRLGFWSALSIVATFLVFTVCFVAIPLTSPLFSWTNLPGYLAYVSNYDQFFQNLARFAMLLFGPLFVLLLSSIHDLAIGEKRILARIGLCFGVIFAALTSTNYFVQLSAVRLSILRGETQGLEQIVQANPLSAISAINVLGWSLFLGLSSLFVAPVFSESRLERIIKLSFLLNGIFCILGGIGYVLDIVVLVFLTLNFGMGGAVLVAAISLCILFRRMGDRLSETRTGATNPVRNHQ